MTDPSAPLRDLVTLGLDIPWPDPDAERAARDHRLERAPGRPVTPWGSLAATAEWLAGVQGVFPPRPPADPRVVVVTSRHLSHADGRTLDDHLTAATALLDGTSALQQLASGHGVRVEVVDGGEVGDIAVEDAGLTTSVVDGVDHGATLTDSMIDDGADLLVLTAVSAGGSTTAATLIAVLTTTEPALVAGRGTGLDDAGWAVKTAAIRDARRRGQDARHDTDALLGAVGGRDIAILAGMVLQAANRRVPVLLDGISAVAAALVARDVSPRITRWMRLGHAGTDAGERIAVQRSGMVPLLDLELSGVGVTAGVGGLVAAQLVDTAARIADAPLSYAVPLPPQPEPEPEPVPELEPQPAPEPEPETEPDDPDESSADV